MLQIIGLSSDRAFFSSLFHTSLCNNIYIYTLVVRVPLRAAWSDKTLQICLIALLLPSGQKEEMLAIYCPFAAMRADGQLSHEAIFFSLVTAAVSKFTSVICSRFKPVFSCLLHCCRRDSCHIVLLLLSRSPQTCVARVRPNSFFCITE